MLLSALLSLHNFFTYLLPHILILPYWNYVFSIWNIKRRNLETNSHHDTSKSDRAELCQHSVTTAWMLVYFLPVMTHIRKGILEQGWLTHNSQLICDSQEFWLKSHATNMGDFTNYFLEDFRVKVSQQNLARLAVSDMALPNVWDLLVRKW